MRRMIEHRRADCLMDARLLLAIAVSAGLLFSACAAARAGPSLDATPATKEATSAEAVADDIAARYAGVDGRSDCFQELNTLVRDRFAEADLGQYFRALYAVAYVCDRVVPGETMAMQAATMVVSAVTGRDYTSVYEDGTPHAPRFWADLVRGHPRLIDKMRR